MSIFELIYLVVTSCTNNSQWQLTLPVRSLIICIWKEYCLVSPTYLFGIYEGYMEDKILYELFGIMITLLQINFILMTIYRIIKVLRAYHRSCQVAKVQLSEKWTFCSNTTVNWHATFTCKMWKICGNHGNIGHISWGQMYI